MEKVLTNCFRFPFYNKDAIPRWVMIYSWLYREFYLDPFVVGNKREGFALLEIIKHYFMKGKIFPFFPTKNLKLELSNEKLLFGSERGYILNLALKNDSLSFCGVIRKVRSLPNVHTFSHTRIHIHTYIHSNLHVVACQRWEWENPSSKPLDKPCILKIILIIPLKRDLQKTEKERGW